MINGFRTYDLFQLDGRHSHGILVLSNRGNALPVRRWHDIVMLPFGSLVQRDFIRMLALLKTIFGGSNCVTFVYFGQVWHLITAANIGRSLCNRLFERIT